MKEVYKIDIMCQMETRGDKKLGKKHYMISEQLPMLTITNEVKLHGQKHTID